jgi:hypothetical protein
VLLVLDGHYSHTRNVEIIGMSRANGVAWNLSLVTSVTVNITFEVFWGFDDFGAPRFPYRQGSLFFKSENKAFKFEICRFS